MSRNAQQAIAPDTQLHQTSSCAVQAVTPDRQPHSTCSYAAHAAGSSWPNRQLHPNDVMPDMQLCPTCSRHLCPTSNYAQHILYPTCSDAHHTAGSYSQNAVMCDMYTYAHPAAGGHAQQAATPRRKSHPTCHQWTQPAVVHNMQQQAMRNRQCCASQAGMPNRQPTWIPHTSPCACPT